jgi:broad specificity phosphatase PhoE
MTWRYFGVALTSTLLLLGAAIPASAAELMTVTFIRHGESYGNASGLIDTSTPGPVLTPKGEQQARDVAALLGDNNYDAIYASTMVRTQLTAAPMSQLLGLPIQVLPGLEEIEAGVFEGTPEAGAASGYGLYPIGWALPGVIPQIPFDKSSVMPGTDGLNGYVFDARVDGALQTMYDNGDRNPVVFSHGGTIMFWTMMNVQNITVQQKLQLLQTAQLDNTDYVVIQGNPQDGWTLVNWNGQQFAPEPTLGADVKLQYRTLSRQLAASVKLVTDAFATRDIAQIATAINRGLADAAFSITKFKRAVNAKVIDEVKQALSPKAPAPAPASTETTSLASTTDKSAAGSVTADVTAKVKAGLDAVKRAKAPKLAAVEAKVDTSAASDDAAELKDTKTAVPAKPNTRPARPGRSLKDTVKDVRDKVTTSLNKLGEPGKKKEKSEQKGETGNAGAGHRGGRHHDAA